MAPGELGARAEPASSPLESILVCRRTTRQPRSRQGGSTKGAGSAGRCSAPAGNDKSVLEIRTGSTEMPALKALPFRGGASNGVLADEIRELSKTLSEIAAAIGMRPDLRSDTVSRLFIFLLFLAFFFSSENKQETFKYNLMAFGEKLFVKGHCGKSLLRWAGWGSEFCELKQQCTETAVSGAQKLQHHFGKWDYIKRSIQLSKQQQCRNNSQAAGLSIFTHTE